MANNTDLQKVTDAELEALGSQTALFALKRMHKIVTALTPITPEQCVELTALSQCVAAGVGCMDEDDG